MEVTQEIGEEVIYLGNKLLPTSSIRVSTGSF